jgi:hypothetical protein
LKSKGRYPSGQRGQSVKLLRKLRWFESSPAHSELRSVDGLRRSRLAWGVAAVRGYRLFAFVALPAVVVALSACEGSGFQYVKNTTDDTGTYFKLPGDWEVYDEDVYFEALGGVVSPQQADVQKETGWTVAFDAAPEPSLAHLTEQLAPEHPTGSARVSLIPPEQRDTFSFAAMRNAFLPLDQLLDAGQAEILRQEPITEGDSFRGLRLTYNVEDPDGGFATFDQTVLVDQATERQYLLVVSCDASCFQENESEIDDVVNSWTVRER